MGTLDKRLIESTPTLIALGLLIGGCVLILLPFTSALVWAAIFVFSTRHLYWRINRWLGGRNWLSASLFVLFIFALIVLPMFYAVLSFGSVASEYAIKISTQLQHGIPALPDWVIALPWVGQKAQMWWEKLILGDSVVRGQLNNALLVGLKEGFRFGAIAGQGLGMLFLSGLISLFFYASLPTATLWLQASMQRVSGSRAQQLLSIAGGTIQGVVFGILGTALAQGFLIGISLFIAGVPSAAGLTFLAFLLSLLPFVNALIWGPAAWWLYQQGHIGMAIFMVSWCVIIVGSADNVIKPLLIGKGSNLPFLLIVLGILGGALQFGVLGIFLGPTLLAIGFALCKEWLHGNDDGLSATSV